jgi:hypothetical protein
MVEFMAAPMYVVFRPAGGLPHVRQFAVGTVNEPRRFKLQALDLWTRQRGQGPQAPGSTAAAGTLFPQFTMTGSLSNNTVSGPGGSSVDFTSDFNSDFA